VHRFPRFVPILLCLAIPAGAQTPYVPSVGSGAPSAQISYDFQVNFYRGTFSSLVALPPLADVHALGATGLVQEFQDTKKTQGVKLALVLPNKAVSGFANDVFQLGADVYGFYSTVGATTAGYPTMDSQICPFVANCTYDIFTNSYAIFVFSAGNPNGTNFSVSGNFYTKWNALGGVAGTLGLVYEAEKTLTSPAGTTAGGQIFNGGAIYSITSGLNSGLTFAVLGAANTLYQSLGGPTGQLGLPVGDQIQLPGGVVTQTFETGKIQYLPGQPPAVLLPVAQIQLTPAGPIALSYGQTATVAESAFDTRGFPASGREISWSTSNGHVVTISTTGNVATLHAVGGGTATVTATSEGKVTPALLVSVTSPCCQVGDGASATVQQAFQDAIARNRIVVQLPGPNAAKRVSAGYTQDLVSPDGITHYLLAQSDASGTAYVLAGSILAAYTQLGGPAGTLGFPASDVSTGGTQLFANNAALAGAPVQMVSAPVFAKWAALRYEAGVAGPPTAAAAPFTSQSEYTGSAQAFSGGAIYGIANSNLAGQAFFVSGPVLARYLALGGPAGEMGVPVTDQFATGGANRQNFENGYIDFATGSAAAQEHLTPRSPSVSANPGTALAGSRLHLAISGFANGATVRVAVTGQPDFLVTTPNGSYGWDVYVSPSSSSATITIHAVDTKSAAAADGSYAVKSLLDAHAQLVKSQGDNQTGPPATILTLPLVVLLQDGTGVPIPNVAVSFTASPGAQISPVSVLTDSKGRAAASLRLPVTGGVAAVTARAAGQIAIFDAQALGSSGISNFPQYSQASIATQLGNGPSTGAQKGALVTAAAAVLRYYQNLGSLPAANGLADPAKLNQYLKTACNPDLSGVKVCDGFVSNTDTGEQVVNLWRLVNFAGSGLDVSVEDTALPSITALVSAGDPVLLNLALTEDSAAAGGTTVTAIGIAADGSLQISDPNPGFAQTSINGYLAGFAAGGHTWKGAILSAVRLLPRVPSPSGFLLRAISQPVSGFPAFTAAAATGSCSAPLVIEDAAVLGATVASPVRQSEFIYCDGTQSSYQVGISASAPYKAAITDLAFAGATRDLSSAAPAGYQVTRASGQFAVSAPVVSFSAASVVNAASFVAAVAPGELISIFGSGLSGPGTATAVTVNGRAAQVLLASPFQINAVIPADLATGTYPLAVSSPFGSVSQSVTVTAEAPGIFILSMNSDGTANGAVVNQDGTINGPSNPLPRGKVFTVYCTGLGAVKNSGSLSVTVATVQATLGAARLPVAFAGLAPGFVGLYQVNVAIPANAPPGLALPFDVRTGSAASNVISVAIQ
jgi:uncharacterized protein (TIGR03437 family)